ncbi:hypothetical protein EBR56_08285 [bacterium]|nr:hypothetical protein [bacterium]
MTLARFRRRHIATRRKLSPRRPWRTWRGQVGLSLSCGAGYSRREKQRQATSAARPRLGGNSFLHRFGSALNHHVHLHACVTDGVFVPPAAVKQARGVCAEPQAAKSRHGAGDRERR